MAETAPTDAEIISASLRDPEAFGGIFDRHYDSVFRFVARRLGVSEAGDAAADVFDRAFRIRGRYDSSKPEALPWLYGIAYNIVGDRLRRKARRERVYLSAAEADLPDHSDEADLRIVAQQIGDRLNQALARIARKDRETILLYALEGLTYSEISEVLGIPVGTVGSRISRARSQILELIPDLEQMISAEDPPPNPGDRP